MRNGSWTPRKEDYAIIVRAPYLEIIAWLEMTMMIVFLQFTRDLIPFVPIKVTKILSRKVDLSIKTSPTYGRWLYEHCQGDYIHTT